MCGIVCEINKKEKVGANILNQYISQQRRGTLGFGLIALGEKATIKKTTTEHEIIESLFKFDCPAIIFHHRQPTSTDNTVESAHPFSVTVGDKIYHTIHNGIIYDHEELYEKMKTRHQFESVSVGENWVTKKPKIEVNDSEVLAVDLAEVISGQKKSMEATGWLAFITLVTDLELKPLEFYFGCNDAPLLMIHDQDKLWLASEGAGTQIKSDTLYSYSLKNHTITQKPLIMPGYVWQSVSKSKKGKKVEIDYSDYDEFNEDQFRENELKLAEYELEINDLEILYGKTQSQKYHQKLSKLYTKYDQLHLDTYGVKVFANGWKGGDLDG